MGLRLENGNELSCSIADVVDLQGCSGWGVCGVSCVVFSEFIDFTYFRNKIG